jgi:hypothetical protein
MSKLASPTMSGHQEKLGGLRFIVVATFLLVSGIRESIAAPLTNIDVVDYQLIASQRVDRTRFDYTYRVVTRNSGAAVAINVTGSASATSSGSMLVDSGVVLGDILAGSTAMSSDSIVVRHDRAFPFNPASLQWSFDGESIRGAIPPANPGEAGKLTLEGIDQNVNGVRDDVERFLLAQAEPGGVRDALMARSRLLGETLTVSSDAAVAHEVAERLLHNTQCLLSLQGEEFELTDSLTARFLNTADRLRAFVQFERLLDGGLFELRNSGEGSTLCVSD